MRGQPLARRQNILWANVLSVGECVANAAVDQGQANANAQAGENDVNETHESGIGVGAMSRLIPRVYNLLGSTSGNRCTRF